MNRRAASILFALLCAAACRRGSGRPDDNYQKASSIYQELYATQLDDAYGDPRMEEVVGLLRKVDSRSRDAAAATAMLGAIERGRAELAKTRAAREKMVAAAEQSASTPVVQIDPRKILAAYATDAGPAQDPYGPGASVADINTGTGGCLSSAEPFNENGTGVSGTVYRLVPGATCAARLPGYAGQAVLVVNGRIYRRLVDPNPPGAVATTPVDGGSPEKTQAPARPPAPPPPIEDAGAPEVRMVYPGQPQPGAAPDAGQQQ